MAAEYARWGPAAQEIAYFGDESGAGRDEPVLQRAEAHVARSPVTGR